ncbi:MAG: SDR family NAD(P)-dependent oxidoreductase, partial [Desulfuromusa sp.]|nr:SDR family NAD(P)-dependent oxidoreductase [Desulfuromusa sp.]
MAKKILITGATSGFGKACAEYFAAQGWQLILTGRRAERLEQLQAQLGTAVRQIIPLDVRDRKQVFEQLGSLDNIDVLLNNAGLALGLEPSWEVNIDDWETMVDTNIKGLMYCTR